MTHSTKNIAIELLCSCWTAFEFGSGALVVEVVSFFATTLTISDGSSCNCGIVVIFTSASDDDLMLKSLGAAELDSPYAVQKMQSKTKVVTLSAYIFG